MKRAKSASSSSASLFFQLIPNKEIPGLTIECRDEEKYIVASRIANTTADSMFLDDIELLKIHIRDKSCTRVFLESQWMLNAYPGIQKLDRDYVSYGMCGVCDEMGNHAFLIGFRDFRNDFFSFSIYKEEQGDIWISVNVHRENYRLDSGCVLELSDLLIEYEGRFSQQLKRYGEAVEQCMKPVKKEWDLISGWCSWYTYYGLESFQDILENLKQLNTSPLREKINVVQIDDGWNLVQSDSPCLWGDWEAGYKFPQGMRAASDAIHKHGFQSGLWVAPFVAAKNSRLAQEHPDWLLEPLDGVDQNADWVKALDLTNPAVLCFVKETACRVFQDYGFDYLKIDFLSYAIMPTKGKRYDSSMTKIQAFRNAMKIIYQIAGDKFILACGSPVLHAVGVCDGMRIGIDTGSQWSYAICTDQWQFGNVAVKPCLKYCISRQWMNQRFWQNDPDCCVVRETGNSYEIPQFEKFFGPYAPEKHFGLTYDEADCWVKMIWTTGGMKLLSEIWDDLSPDRKALVERLFTENPYNFQMADYYVSEEIYSMEALENGEILLALFNASDDETVIEFPAERYGLREWKFVELWSGQSFSGKGEVLRFPPIPKHSARIWRLQPTDA